jgi:aminopeptidase N
MHIPLEFGLVGADGRDLAYASVEGAAVENGVIHLRKRRHTLTFSGIGERPAVSLNRGFSAPVTLSIEQNAEDQIFLARHDADPFSRWQSFNTVMSVALVAGSKSVLGERVPDFAPAIAELAGAILRDDGLEQAFRALALTPPGEFDIARELGSNIDPDAIHAAREALVHMIAEANRDLFEDAYDRLADQRPFSPDAASAGRRALRNVLLDYLTTLPGGAEIASRHFNEAANMTDRAAGLTALVHRHRDAPETQQALAAFEKAFAGHALVLDKWFAIQAAAPGAQTADAVRRLAAHPAFSIANPNRLRSLFGTFFSGNQTSFHRADGAGYALFVETILTVEKRNPQVAARLATGLRSWRSLEPKRRELARRALSSIASTKDLSADLRDIIERTLS